VKQSYTRVQAGATIGGPIQKDKTFYFFSYEITRRQETGFSSIGADNFGLVPTAVPGDIEPFLPTGTPTSGYLTQPQVTFVDNTANPFADRVNVYALGVGSSAVAIFGNTPGFPANFFPNIFGFASPAPLPTSYHGLASVIGNFPTSEGTSLWSLRLDHIWNAANSSFIRADVSPSTITGIEVNAQNQNFGQNAGSRTSDQQTRDLAIIAQHTTAISPTLFNEARFQFARRGLHYGYSDLPGGGDPAIDLTGYAFFGREPFSVEDRTEKRYQFTDNLSWTKGTHSMKFGADFNLIQLGTTKDQTFTLNYGGVYDFAGLSASSFGINSPNAPGFSAIQAYGLGLPESFYQGIGSTNRPFDDKSLGVFAQDSWKISKRLTLNYGVRYDIEFLPIFPASTSINQIAEKALGVVEGIPTDSNNVAPRIGVAWDPFGDGKTIIRAGYGFFYDHPALALAFLSTTFDGAQSSLLEAAGGTPSYASLDNPANFPALNAASIFQGTLTGAITGCSTNTATPQMCYQANEQRFSTTYGNSLFNNQNFLPSASNPVGFPLPLLPYTIPITKNFQNALAQQANLTVERQLANDWKVSAGYTYTHGTHLDRTININVANPALLVENAYNGELTGYISPASNPQGVAVPSTVNTACPGGIPAYNVPGAGSIAFATPTGEPLAPSILGYGYTGQNCSGTPVGFVASAAVFNFFRKSGTGAGWLQYARGTGEHRGTADRILRDSGAVERRKPGNIHGQFALQRVHVDSDEAVLARNGATFELDVLAHDRRFDGSFDVAESPGQQQPQRRPRQFGFRSAASLDHQRRDAESVPHARRRVLEESARRLHGRAGNRGCVRPSVQRAYRNRYEPRFRDGNEQAGCLQKGTGTSGIAHR